MARSWGSGSPELAQKWSLLPVGALSCRRVSWVLGSVCYFDCSDGPTGVDVECVRFIALQVPPRGLSAGAAGSAQRRAPLSVGLRVRRRDSTGRRGAGPEEQQDATSGGAQLSSLPARG